MQMHSSGEQTLMGILQCGCHLSMLAFERQGLSSAEINLKS
jgi:hypothetical protein